MPPKSYSELTSGIRYAQTLYEADHTDAYVEIALEKKGFSKQEAQWIMLSAEVENVEHRKKVSLIIALVMGIAWGVILFLYFYTPNTENNLRDMEDASRFITVKHVGICLLLFLGGVFNFIRSYFQVKKARRKLELLPMLIF